MKGPWVTFVGMSLLVVLAVVSTVDGVTAALDERWHGAAMALVLLSSATASMMVLWRDGFRLVPRSRATS